MPTARARMLELSPLGTGSTARAHFVAITQTGGTGGDVFVGAPLVASIGNDLTAYVDSTLSASIYTGVVNAKIDQNNSSLIETDNEATICQ